MLDHHLSPCHELKFKQALVWLHHLNDHSSIYMRRFDRFSCPISSPTATLMPYFRVNTDNTWPAEKTLETPQTLPHNTPLNGQHNYVKYCNIKKGQKMVEKRHSYKISSFTRLLSLLTRSRRSSSSSSKRSRRTTWYCYPSLCWKYCKYNSNYNVLRFISCLVKVHSVIFIVLATLVGRTYPQANFFIIIIMSIVFSASWIGNRCVQICLSSDQPQKIHVTVNNMLTLPKRSSLQPWRECDRLRCDATLIKPPLMCLLQRDVGCYSSSKVSRLNWHFINSLLIHFNF